MADILLTYADADQAAGQALEEALLAAGFAVMSGAPPSDRARLATRAKAAHAVVVLWSRRASGSPAVLRQAAQARRAGNLVAARIDKNAPPALFARGLPHVDLSSHTGLDDLLARLAAPAAAAAPMPKSAASAPTQTALAAPTQTRKGGAALWWIAGGLLLLVALALGLNVM